MRISIRFYLDNPKATRNSSIYFRAMVNKVAYKLTSGVSIEPKYWDLNKERATTNSPNFMIVNNKLNEIKDFIEDLVYRLEKENRFTHEEFKALLTQKLKGKTSKAEFISPSQKTFFKIWDDFIEHNEKNDKVSFRVILLYKRARKYLYEFSPNLTFEKIDDKFLTEYKTYLIKKKKLEINGTIPLFKNALFVFLNWATKQGLNSNLNYKDFKLTITEKHHNIYLTLEEIQLFNKLENLPNYLSNTRDWLMLMCFSGLRVSDALRLNYTNIYLNERYISLIMQKTNQTVKIPILKLAEPYIIKLLNGEIHPISSQKLNDYYKELGKLAGIDTPTIFTTYTPLRNEKTVPKYELITNHCFRRSFATISLSLGVQPSIIMKITGHKTLSSFEKYIGFSVQNAMDEMQKAWSKVSLD